MSINNVLVWNVCMAQIKKQLRRKFTCKTGNATEMSEKIIDC